MSKSAGSRVCDEFLVTIFFKLQGKAGFIVRIQGSNTEYFI